MNKSCSIITPLHNAENFLEETIKSVLEQTNKNWEMIIVDDCSTDRSLVIAENYAKKDNRIKIIKLEKNSGAAVARNCAIEVASGRFIAFLDSDDLWHPRKLEKQINFMLNRNVEFSYTFYSKINEFGESKGVMKAPQKVGYRDLLKTCVIGCLTVIYDSEKLGKIYMPKNTRREDYATWLNILKITDFAYGLPEVLSNYRIYNGQSSSNKLKMAKENWFLYRNIENIGIFRSLYYFSNYAVRGVLRNKFPKIALFLKIL